MGETFAEIVTSGPVLLGVAVAVIAGLVSFLSPCILPLVPGYLAYVTGLSGADADRPADRRADDDQRADHERVDRNAGRVGEAAHDRPSEGRPRTATVERRAGAFARNRVLAGGLLFVVGFGAVFVTMGVIAASVGRLLRDHQRVLEIGGGVLMIVFALALLGLVPAMQREVRSRWLPAAGVAGAPIFGAVFALSWIPCIGPTIGAVLALGTLGGDPGRAAVLAAAYSLGLGLPFILFGLGFRWMLGAVAAIRRHTVWITRAGAVLLAVIGLALLTGAWDEFILWLRGAIVGFEVII
ncbi:cytochrome c biogenesis protein CcdA [Natronosporangium hydrolyticum]|uniref:Cytochrome c biogenesis protein CcdA n=1 Tax=Natronosporangium hydrolyticum TaxID=2811111 RepID=A0A895YHB0_9ACTN|nr:cytochrome c biogenesis protein CcdA [Natronosporangium hydrolyticum]QSB14899.1 cytochrome c biogenesis protein CcdA [Natronosporangium hydrolyticum]